MCSFAWFSRSSDTTLLSAGWTETVDIASTSMISNSSTKDKDVSYFGLSCISIFIMLIELITLLPISLPIKSNIHSCNTTTNNKINVFEINEKLFDFIFRRMPFSNAFLYLFGLIGCICSDLGIINTNILVTFFLKIIIIWHLSSPVAMIIRKRIFPIIFFNIYPYIFRTYNNDNNNNYYYNYNRKNSTSRFRSIDGKKYRHLEYSDNNTSISSTTNSNDHHHTQQQKQQKQQKQQRQQRQPKNNNDSNNNSTESLLPFYDSNNTIHNDKNDINTKFRGYDNDKKSKNHNHHSNKDNINVNDLHKDNDNDKKNEWTLSLLNLIQSNKLGLWLCESMGVDTSDKLHSMLIWTLILQWMLAPFYYFLSYKYQMMEQCNYYDINNGNDINRSNDICVEHLQDLDIFLLRSMSLICVTMLWCFGSHIIAFGLPRTQYLTKMASVSCNSISNTAFCSSTTTTNNDNNTNVNANATSNGNMISNSRNSTRGTVMKSKRYKIRNLSPLSSVLTSTSGFDLSWYQYNNQPLFSWRAIGFDTPISTGRGLGIIGLCALLSCLQCFYASFITFKDANWITIAMLWIFFQVHLLVSTCTIPCIFVLFQKYIFVRKMKNLLLPKLSTLLSTSSPFDLQKNGEDDKIMNKRLLGLLMDHVVTEYVLGGLVSFQSGISTATSTTSSTSSYSNNNNANITVKNSSRSIGRSNHKSKSKSNKQLLSSPSLSMQDYNDTNNHNSNKSNNIKEVERQENTEDFGRIFQKTLFELAMEGIN